MQQKRPAVNAGRDFLDLVAVAAAPVALAFAPIGEQDQNGQRGAVVVQGCDDFALDVLAGSDSIGLDDAGGMAGNG